MDIRTRVGHWADKWPCELLRFDGKSVPEEYSEGIRQFQGCPTIAITAKGRLFAGWYSGGIREPSMDNYNLLVVSDDGGETWSEPVIVIPSRKECSVQALDIQLWTDPKGRLHVCWVQNNTLRIAEHERGLCAEQGVFAPDRDTYAYPDITHAEWESVCEEPDAPLAELRFSEPKLLFPGFLRCKPTVLSSGRIVACAYDQADSRYGYELSDDGGETWRRVYGAEKIPTPFDETQVFERKDGTCVMFARTYCDTGEIAMTVSHDRCETWEPARRSGIDAPNTRFFVSRTPSGRILLVNNDARDSRRNMTLYLSEDEGQTWAKDRIDAREDVSYPDVVFDGNDICLVYDRERTGAKEILFVRCTEEDILAGREIRARVISRP